MDLQFLITATRARVYLLWAVLVPAGFVATHYYQDHTINYVWSVIAAIGLLYMWRVMPMRVGQMQRIFLAWLVPIVLGIVFSGVLFYIDAAWASNLIGRLGAVWLGVMALGYVLNGLVDPPSGWYWFAAILNAGFAVVCYGVDAFLPVQYLVAAVISVWSMTYLWLFRSDI